MEERDSDGVIQRRNHSRFRVITVRSCTGS